MIVKKDIVKVFGLEFTSTRVPYVSATVKELMTSKRIRKIFSVFKTILPNHPDPENTHMIFIPHYNVRPKYWEILFICEHFEHVDLEDLSALLGFMKLLADEFETNYVYLMLLNGITEKLVIQVDTFRSRVIPKKVREAIRDLIK